MNEQCHKFPTCHCAAAVLNEPCPLIPASVKQANMAKPSAYTPEDLKDQARRMVKGFGKFLRYEVEVSNHGARLVAYFIRDFNRSRPISSQAVERHTLAL